MSLQEIIDQDATALELLIDLAPAYGVTVEICRGSLFCRSRSEREFQELTLAVKTATAPGCGAA